MATNEPNKPDNVIHIDTAKTQAEEKTAPDQPVQAGGDAPAPEKTTGAGSNGSRIVGEKSLLARRVFQIHRLEPGSHSAPVRGR